jgi:hypothetical protein
VLADDDTGSAGGDPKARLEGHHGPQATLRAVIGLHRAVVDQHPAPHRLEDEAGVTVVVGLGNRLHGPRR